MQLCKRLYAGIILAGVIKLDACWFSRLMLASIMLATERFVRYIQCIFALLQFLPLIVLKFINKYDYAHSWEVLSHQTMENAT